MVRYRRRPPRPKLRLTETGETLTSIITEEHGRYAAEWCADDGRVVLHAVRGRGERHGDVDPTPWTKRRGVAALARITLDEHLRRVTSTEDASAVIFDSLWRVETTGGGSADVHTA